MPIGVYVRKLRPLADRFWEKVDVRGPDECWPWTACKLPPYGYGQINDHGRARLASHVCWELHFGPIPDGMDVLHSCDNPPCVNPAHLFLGTDADNTADKMAKGRHRYGLGKRYGNERVPPKGEEHGMSKMTAAQVIEIRQMRGTQRAIGDHFGITQAQVSNIKLRKHWKEVRP